MEKSFEKSQLKQWELFRATNYFTLMWPSFLLLKLHGLFPYKIIITRFVLSKIGYSMTRIIVILYILLLGFILYHVNISTALAYDSVPGTLQGHSYLLLGWLLAIFYYSYYNKRMNLLDNIAKVSSKIPSRLFSHLSKIIHTKDLIGFLFLMAQSPNIFSSNPLLIANKFLILYTTLIVYFMDMLYMNCVLIIGACFEDINEKLIKLKFNIDRDEPHMLRRIYHVEHNSVIVTDVQLIMKEHNEISDLVNELNHTFSLQLITTVIMTFAEITFSLYFYILEMVGAKEINLEKQLWYSYFITSVTYYAVKLTTMVWACERSKSRAMETGIVVHQIMNNTVDREIIEELQLFSLQLLHRDNRFIARGLAIDALLLTSIVGGITTYLLILIQFLVSSNSCATEVTKIPNSTTAPLQYTTIK
ncbi:hypothetical protein PV327_009540 [Microctonus hyperodae]|uniref:Gustatory receptor n=1 Tax=Microctonus hyperodae TaxID=165561 RepID=A0AA39CAN3_MICHY|nr:hypothetical protein PV327_009540 [Microctonus hyperodae]